jgi:WD40 repeat protein
MESGEELASICEHKEAVMAVAFSSDGKRALSASADKTVVVWTISSEGDEKSIQLIKSHSLVGHKAAVNSVAVAPDSQSAVSGSSDTTLKIWNLNSGKETRVLTGHSDPVLCCVVSPCGKFILSSSQDNTTRLWCWSTGKELKQVSLSNIAIQQIDCMLRV